MGEQQSGLRSLTPARARAFRQVSKGRLSTPALSCEHVRVQIEITRTGRSYRTTLDSDKPLGCTVRANGTMCGRFLHDNLERKRGYNGAAATDVVQFRPLLL